MLAPYKIRQYVLHGPHKGEASEEEYYYTLHDVCDRYRELFRRELRAYNPTVWRRDDDGLWIRMTSPEIADR